MYNEWMQLPDAIDKIRPSVVQIRATGSGTSSEAPAIGTGFVVTTAGHVVTALHVVQPPSLPAGQSLSVGFAGPTISTPVASVAASFVVVPARLHAGNREHDLAIIETANMSNSDLKIKVLDQDFDITPTPATLYSGEIRDGISLAVSGYPLSKPSLVTNAGVLASTFAVQSQGGEWRKRYLGDFTTNRGNSGGPVYTVNDAAVIGVHVATQMAPIRRGTGQQTAGLAVIVPIAEVMTFLIEQGLVSS
jgi:S1-C subfamily serine protease